MRSHTFTFVTLAALFLWAGLIIGISFIEAPIKFTAPGITLALGLGIGRLVFGVMNKVEIAFCALAVLGLLFNHATIKEWGLLSLIAGLLVLQTFWLLPALDVRAVAIIDGQSPPASVLHFVYVAFEFLKFRLLLFTAGMVHKSTVQVKHAERLRIHRLQELVS
ncbi:hypothetical protein ACD591_14675 [Rufibacter glacialis]|uniref:DUF4149 domain-containing protein n=1 Tax=Rufibacter glacialis TaxID=1259555 RepID=A0ABV4RHF3_9BACT|nr:hypothetical protein [Rufibacter glacialis]GGK56184.1 hypothetical protein GCM10011405_00430 [Rufibacter glacialis]